MLRDPAHSVPIIEEILRSTPAVTLCLLGEVRIPLACIGHRTATHAQKAMRTAFVRRMAAKTIGKNPNGSGGASAISPILSTLCSTSWSLSQSRFGYSKAIPCTTF
jgi:hypothetical protein